MTHITIERTRRGPAHRFPPVHFQAVESPLPQKPAMDVCPHCQLARRSQTTLGRLKSALLQLLVAVLTIVWSVIRLARLAVGMVLCLVGVIGFGLHSLASQIVHPVDRRLLPLTQSRGN